MNDIFVVFMEMHVFLLPSFHVLPPTPPKSSNVACFSIVLVFVLFSLVIPAETGPRGGEVAGICGAFFGKMSNITRSFVVPVLREAQRPGSSASKKVLECSTPCKLAEISRQSEGLRATSFHKQRNV